MADIVTSIIIPCYNMGQFLQAAIESVEKVYDSSKHEILIIDDGSDDPATLEVLSQIKSHRVIHKKNGGVSSARNTGIKNSKGKYLIFLDVDNLLTDGYLKQGVEVLETHTDVDIVYGLSEKFGAGEGILPTEKFCLQTLMSYNYIDACCLVRKNLFSEMGGFDETRNIQAIADWELWLRSAFRGKKFYFLQNTVIQKYRVRKDSMMKSMNQDKRGRDEAFEYLVHKFPEYLSFKGVSNFYFKKFDEHTFGWTLKLFLRKFAPSLYQKLILKGKISKFL